MTRSLSKRRPNKTKQKGLLHGWIQFYPTVIKTSPTVHFRELLEDVEFAKEIGCEFYKCEIILYEQTPQINNRV